MEVVVAVVPTPTPLARDLDRVLDETRPLWEDLRGNRVFITGGTGFFGAWLLETFTWAAERLNLNAVAVVLTRRAAAFRASAPHLAGHAAVEILEGDVRSFTYPDGRFTHVIHAATDSSGRHGALDPLVLFDTIVSGTRRALEFSGHAGVRRILLTSSGAVYGPVPSGVTHVSEDVRTAPDPTDVRSAYGEGKRASEALCALYASATLQPAIARCFAFVGPHLPLDVHFAVGNFLLNVLKGEPIEIRGDGTPFRSYLYASDLAVWLWTILFRGAALRPYNVGSEDAVSIRDLAGRVARLSTPAVPVHIAEEPRPGATPLHYVPCTRRAREELGLRQTIGLDDALARTLAWHRVRTALTHGHN